MDVMLFAGYFVLVGCGGVVEMDGRRQYITSPGYPRNYSNNLDCIWLIKVFT